MSSSKKVGEKKSTKSQSAAITVASLDETYKKVMSSLLPSIEDHVSSKDYSAKSDSLDFLSAKNSLLLSYLIDLVQLIRLIEKKKLAQKRDKDDDGSDSHSDDEDDNIASRISTDIESCLARLNEMKCALDKVRPVEKKMRYQLDRLLAAASDAASFAAGGEESDEDEADTGGMKPSANADPLSFRPNLAMMGSDNDDDDDDAAEEEPSDVDDDDNSDDDDDDLRAAKAVARAGSSSANKKKRGSTGHESDDDDDKKNAIYQPPRLAAVPFAEREKAEEKAERALARQRRRMRQSELLQTLRAADGTDRPEEDDLDGGAALGKQKEAARRMAEREAEKTKFEEEMMVRLTQSRKDKKARGRMMREEQSNLGAIADLGRLAAGVADAFGGSDDGGDSDGGGGLSGMVGGRSGADRYDNGKRRRGGDDYAEIDGDRRRRKSGMKGSNSHQRALHGTEGKKKKRKSKR